MYDQNVWDLDNATIGHRGHGYRYALLRAHPNADARGRVMLHRAVMENHLRRLLAPTEVVHHKDEDPSNNDLSNLELKTRAEHTVHHHLTGLSVVELTCRQCETSFLREARNVNGAETFCSRRCSTAFYGAARAALNPHGSPGMYRKGCRCMECKRVHNLRVKEWRKLRGVAQPG